MFHRKFTLGGLVVLVAVAACAVPTTKTDTGKSDDGGGKISARRTPAPSPTVDPNKPKPSPTATAQRVVTPPTPVPTPTPERTPVPPGMIDFRPLTGNPNPDGKTTLTGAVFNNAGVKFEKDAKIIYKLKDGAEAEVTIEGGKYVLPDLKPGSYSITATEYGSTPRTQHVSLIKGVDYTLNFGEPETDTQVYALFDKPEISEVVPDQFKADLKGDTLSFKLSLSEPATEASIRALVNNLRLAPMNAVAAGSETAPPVLAPKSHAEDGPSDVNVSAFPWSIKFFDTMDFDPAAPDNTVGTKFFTAKAAFSKTLDQFITVTFAAPIFNGPTPAEYQLFVVADPAHKTLDLDDKLLGTDKTGGLDTHPTDAGQVLNNVFLSPYLSPANFKKDTPETQWDSTHTNAIPLKLVPDTTAPAVTAVSVVVDGLPAPADPKVEDPYPDGVHIKVDFNEPIAVVGPGGVTVRESVLKVSNYSFMVGINTAYLSDTTLSDGSINPEQELAWNSEGFGTGGVEFRVKEDANVKVAAVGPKSVRIYIPNNKFFDLEKAKAFSVRVAGIQDPAGNVLKDEQANKLAAQPRVAIQYKFPTP